MSLPLFYLEVKEKRPGRAAEWPHRVWSRGYL